MNDARERENEVESKDSSGMFEKDCPVSEVDVSNFLFDKESRRKINPRYYRGEEEEGGGWSVRSIYQRRS